MLSVYYLWKKFKALYVPGDHVLELGKLFAPKYLWVAWSMSQATYAVPGATLGEKRDTVGLRGWSDKEKLRHFDAVLVMKIQLVDLCESPTLIWQMVLKLCRPLWVTSLDRQEVHTSDKGIKIIIITHSAQKQGFNPSVGQPRECKFVQSFLRHFGSLESL